MADATPQSYATHAYRPTAWNIVWLICVVALVFATWVAVRDRTAGALIDLLLAAGLTGTISLLRIFVLRVQDRVIRLEMRVRMARLGLDAEFEQLQHRQLIALRFASDAELAALAHRAIAEKLPPDHIKRAVSRWQGDYFRT
jgi:hypothetical protein